MVLLEGELNFRSERAVSVLPPTQLFLRVFKEMETKKEQKYNVLKVGNNIKDGKYFIKARKLHIYVSDMIIMKTAIPIL